MILYRFRPKSSRSKAVGSGCVRGSLPAQNRIEGVGVARRAQLRGRRRIAKHARQTRQRLQMIGASRFRSDEEKDEIDGRPVERFKIDRTRRSREKSEHLFRFGELGMRNSYPIASPGRAETLPLNQSVENFPRREPRKFGGAFAQLLQGLFL